MCARAWGVQPKVFGNGHSSFLDENSRLQLLKWHRDKINVVYTSLRSLVEHVDMSLFFIPQ